jgi:transketolase
MRKAFIDTLIKQAHQNDKTWLLVADVGYNLVEPFQKEFPDRFVNVGIAEQNMIGVAAGLALSGKTVFCYSLVNFPTLRCLEQIRNDVCYHNADVKIVSGGVGLAYGSLGFTHHATEDMAIMRALPNIIIESPCDPVETELAVEVMCSSPKPYYLRLSKTGDDVIYGDKPDFKVGKAIRLCWGKDVAFISCGSIMVEVLKAVELLKSDGMESSVWSMHTIKPIDVMAVVEAVKSKVIVTVEEHNILGGLGSAVAEILSHTGLECKHRIIGIPDCFTKEVGSQQYLRERYGLTGKWIAKIVKEKLDAGLESTVR